MKSESNFKQPEGLCCRCRENGRRSYRASYAPDRQSRGFGSGRRRRVPARWTADAHVRSAGRWADQRVSSSGSEALTISMVQRCQRRDEVDGPAAGMAMPPRLVVRQVWLPNRSDDKVERFLKTMASIYVNLTPGRPCHYITLASPIKTRCSRSTDRRIPSMRERMISSCSIDNQPS